MHRYLGLVFTLWPRWIPRTHPIHPDFIPDPDFHIAPPVEPKSPTADELGGVYPGAKQQPFYGDNPAANTLENLLSSMSTVISSFTNAASINTANTSSSIDYETLTLTAESDAQLGCSIYEQYQTYCKVGPITTSTYCPNQVPGLNLCAPPGEEELFASCACYSGTMWVPDLYDNAVWACDQYTTGTNLTHWDMTMKDPTFTYTTNNEAITTAYTVVWGFCAGNNPRNLSYASELGVTAAAATPESGSSPSSSPAGFPAASTPSPTQSSGAGSFIARGHDGMVVTYVVMLGSLISCLCLT